MGYAVIMFVIMLLMAVSIALSANYGISKDSQEAPLLAENAYAEREGGKMQTDLVINATKINGTAIYSSVDQSPNLLNIHLNIKNTGSIVLDPREYSILLNNSWARISLSSNNVTTPLNDTNVSSHNLVVTPSNPPMQPLSLVVTAGNGVKIITPTSPRLDEDNYTVKLNQSDPEKNCWYDLNISWLPSYGEMWPISYYTVYYMDDDTPQARIDKNVVHVGFTTASNTNYFLGRAFRSTKGSCAAPTGNASVFVWVSATDTHGNEGPPSNTCYSRGSGQGNNECNVK